LVAPRRDGARLLAGRAAAADPLRLVAVAAALVLFAAFDFGVTGMLGPLMDI
jgi:hypothetical protein